jgi:hypothetical protein
MTEDNALDSSINVVIDYTQKVTLIRFLGNHLLPAYMSIRAEVIPSEYTKEIDFDVTFAKIKFWFDTIVARSVVFCRTNKAAIDMIMKENEQPNIANHIMITPYEPNDEHLASLFQSKMTALSGGTINFGCVRIKTDSNGLVFTYVGDWEEDLPKMEDWFATKQYYFDAPWWTRDDVSTLDMTVGEIDPTVLPAWAFNLNFIEESIRPKRDVKEDEESVVIKGTFQPKIIDGGQTDE